MTEQRHHEKAREWLAERWVRPWDDDISDKGVIESLAALLAECAAEAVRVAVTLGVADAIELATLREQVATAEREVRTLTDERDVARVKMRAAVRERDQMQSKVTAMARINPGASGTKTAAGVYYERAEAAEAERDALALRCAALREAVENALAAVEYARPWIPATEAGCLTIVREREGMARAALATPDSAADAMVERVRAEERERCRAYLNDAVREAYPVDVFIPPKPGEHGATVDGCSAAALRGCVPRLADAMVAALSPGTGGAGKGEG